MGIRKSVRGVIMASLLSEAVDWEWQWAEKRALRVLVKVLRIVMTQGKWGFPPHPRDSTKGGRRGVHMLRTKPPGGPQARLRWGRVLRIQASERVWGQESSLAP